MRVSGVNSTVNFQRRPTKNEERDLKENINKAYEIMGVKERAVITHGSCFPSGNMTGPLYYYPQQKPDVQHPVLINKTAQRDCGIGSPYGKAAKEYLKFLALYGFNSNQLGPGGELQKGSVSPYNSSAFAQNRLFIDLAELTGAEYGHILSDTTYNKISSLPEINDKNYTMTDFKRAGKIYDIALKEAYNNFNISIAAYDDGHIFKNHHIRPVLILNNQYQKFLKKYDNRLTEEGIFKVLSNKYGTDDYTVWPDSSDRTLITDIKKGDKKAIKRFVKIYRDNYDYVEQYKFEQFLITKQIKEHKKWREENNFKYINDLLVGCSKMDAWRYEDVFLDDWEMGAFESGGPSQRWHIPVIDPKKIFLNSDYELNDGGKFLKEKIDSALEYCENLRIDHVMGLVEPYLLAKNADDEDFITNPPHLKNKNNEKYISELKHPDNPEIEYDLYWDYTKIIEHLVLPAFEEHGLDKNEAVWEDICSWPDRYKRVYKEQDLPAITNLDWDRAENTVKESPENWFILGNHDSPPAMTYLRRTAKLHDGRKVEYTRKQESWSPEYLAGYLNMDDSRENIEQIRSQLIGLYKNDDRAIVCAKFAELLTTPKFQISFDDLLGITDVIYNIPGTSNETNWRARITADYQDKYYENLSSENPTALNIPELLSKALQAKIDMEVKAHNYDERFKELIYEKAQPVMDKLKYYAEILKEKEF